MSTLLIEGGHRLSGSVDVEGNKNAALPLLAACLLTTEECVLTNVPRISDVEVMARLLSTSAREVDGIGSTTLRVRCPDIVKDEPDPALVGRLRGSVLLLGPLLARRGRAHLAPPGRRLSGAAHASTRISKRWRRWARVRIDAPGHALEAPERSAARRRSTCTRRRSPAPKPRCSPRRPRRARRRFATPRASRTSSSCASSCKQLGVGITGAGTIDDSDRRRREAARRRHIGCGATTSKRGAGRSSRRSPAARSRCAAPGREDMEVVAAVLTRHGRSSARWTTTSSASSASRLRAAGRITTGLWPGFPSDLVSLVTVLATQAEGQTLVHDWLYELRLFALEQLSGMSADLFLCDPHRIIVTGPRQAARAAARQPRSAIGDGAHCRGARGRRPEPAVAARDGRARLRAAGGAAAGSWARRSRSCRRGLA